MGKWFEQFQHEDAVEQATQPDPLLNEV